MPWPQRMMVGDMRGGEGNETEARRRRRLWAWGIAGQLSIKTVTRMMNEPFTKQPYPPSPWRLTGVMSPSMSISQDGDFHSEKTNRCPRSVSLPIPQPPFAQPILAVGNARRNTTKLCARLSSCQLYPLCVRKLLKSISSQLRTETAKTLQAFKLYPPQLCLAWPCWILRLTVSREFRRILTGRWPSLSAHSDHDRWRRSFAVWIMGYRYIAITI